MFYLDNHKLELIITLFSQSLTCCTILYDWLVEQSQYMQRAEPENAQEQLKLLPIRLIA
jgi:hypothetical protein